MGEATARTETVEEREERDLAESFLDEMTARQMALLDAYGRRFPGRKLDQANLGTLALCSLLIETRDATLELTDAIQDVARALQETAVAAGIVGAVEPADAPASAPATPGIG